MKRFLQGLVAGALIVGAAWAAVHIWTRFGIRESNAVENVVKATLESKLRGAEFLDIVQYSEVPPSALDLSALSRKVKHFEVEVAYRRNDQIKRMLIPIFVERGGWQTPAADVLERLDSQAQVTLDTNGPNKPVERMSGTPGLVAIVASVAPLIAHLFRWPPQLLSI